MLAHQGESFFVMSGTKKMAEIQFLHDINNNIYTNTSSYVNIVTKIVIWRFWFHIPAQNFPSQTQ